MLMKSTATQINNTTMTRIYNRCTEKHLRRALRKQATPAEKRLWYFLNGKQVDRCKFRRQYSISGFVVDMYAAEIRLAIEVDGDVHQIDDNSNRDVWRQQFIESLGIRIPSP